MTTLITHVFNEQYLIPFWLEHHKKIFDNLIVIDYHSTDNTVHLCKTLWPGCDVRTTRNASFDCTDADREVMDIEDTVKGIKMVLNTTEFLFCKVPIHTLFKNEPISYSVNCFSPYSHKLYHVTTLHGLVKNLFNHDITYHTDRKKREIHTFSNGNYEVGRHRTFNFCVDTDSLYIVWFGYYPMNYLLLSRKLQIQHNMTQRDKELGLGFHHFVTSQEIQEINYTKAMTGRSLIDINPELYNVLQQYIQIV